MHITSLSCGVNVNLKKNGIATTIISKRTFIHSEGLQKPLKEESK